MEKRNGCGKLGAVFFNELELLFDTLPQEGAAMNMAVDEAVLTLARRPVLRVYGWKRPAVTFGYFDAWREVVARYPGVEAVRRWTGGGVVEHGADWTYSLMVPRGEPFAALSAADSYQRIHAILAEALSDEQAGVNGISLTPEAALKVSAACFENPARHDVLRDGRKIAGAAQRRSRHGLLHQGSVQAITVPATLAERFAARLASSCSIRELTREERARAEALAEQKYATPAWNERY